MTKVIYGYSGEGSGHSSRTREMAGYLLDCGHDVRLASYDRGFQNLADDFDVLEIEGLTISSTENRVSTLATIGDNLKRLPQGTRALGQLRILFKQFQPDVVICDFEPMTAYLAEHYNVPLISLDNQHRMRYVENEIVPGQQAAARMTRQLIRAMVPWPSVSLITALVDGQPTNDRAFVFPPIVRSAVRQATPEPGEHILVYLTSGFDAMLPALQSLPREQFRVYGYDRNDQVENVRFLKPGQSEFVRDLASARGVIATAGFTLISEALFLGKPYLAFPMLGQYEQELNAWQLQRAGFGLSSIEPTSEAIGNFLYRIPDMVQRLEDYPRDDGEGIKIKLDELVADGAALARQFKEQRDAN